MLRWLSGAWGFLINYSLRSLITTGKGQPYKREKGRAKRPLGDQAIGERTMKDTRRKERKTMTTHKTGTREEWLAARLELLKKAA
jgi:hypothetical protein